MFHMELLQLRYFLHTAETENISATAKAFMVPPSGVSASIKKLERELGICLFTRTANRISLNENGRIYYKALKNAFRLVDGARLEIRERTGEIGGEIRLLILTNRSLVTKQISEFKKKYPAVSFTIQHLPQEKNSAYDIIVSDKEPEKDRFTAYPFVREELFLAVHRDNHLVKETQVTPKQLAGEKFICMPRGTSLRTHMDTLFHQNGIAPAIVIECDDPYYICEYVKMGLGVTFFPDVSWKRQADDRIHLLRMGDGLYRNSSLYLNKGTSAAARLFAENVGTLVQK